MVRRLTRCIAQTAGPAQELRQSLPLECHHHTNPSVPQKRQNSNTPPSVQHFPRHKPAEMPFQIINWLFATEPCLAGVPWKNWIAARDKSDGNLSYLIRPLPDARHRTRDPIIIFWPRTFKGDRSCPSATYAPLCRATSYKQCVSIWLQNGLLCIGRLTYQPHPPSSSTDKKG